MYRKEPDELKTLNLKNGQGQMCVKSFALLVGKNQTWTRLVCVVVAWTRLVCVVVD